MEGIWIASHVTLWLLVLLELLFIIALARQIGLSKKLIVYLAVLLFSIVGVGIALGIPQYTAIRSVIGPIPDRTFPNDLDSAATATGAPVLHSNTFYVVATGWTPDAASPILAVDSKTGVVSSLFQARYKPVVALSPDQGELYIVDSFWPQTSPGDVVHALTALDTQAGSVLWEIELPGQRNPYIGDPATGLWTSADGSRVYVLMGATDALNPRIIVVNTVARKGISEIHIALPHDPRWHWPRFWKPAWAEELIVVSQDQLFTVDLDSGIQGEAITLSGFTPEDRARIPKNLNQSMGVQGGDIATDARRLYLVTNAQDVLVVELDGTLTAQRVFTLPSGWQVGLNTPVVVSPNGRLVYFGVRRNDLPVYRARMAEEVWLYDTISWQRLGTVRPGERDNPSPEDPGFIDMALSRDGQRLYTINYQTLTLSTIDIQTMTEISSKPLDTFQAAMSSIIAP